MSLDFQQIRQQVQQIGASALQHEERMQSLRQIARQLLQENAHQLEDLRGKVQQVVQNFDNALHCALPAAEPLDAHLPTPETSNDATLIAADGSQINLDRHAEVQYCLVNVGGIQMCQGSPAAPTTVVESRLLFGEDLYTETGTLTDATLAIMRDLDERRMLAELAEAAAPPVIAVSDGQMELWVGSAAEGRGSSEFQQLLDEYKQVLSRLYDLGVTAAGYVDKPAANLVVRTLEVSMLSEGQLTGVKREHPLRGVTDRDLYGEILSPGERSAVFELQFKSAGDYADQLAIHFFYLNVGRGGLARVEIPAWVADSPEMLAGLHAALVEQCRIMGSRPYPYLLHRAHEVAVVSMQEKEQVTQMIARELRLRGIPVGERSYKQTAKDLPGRGRYPG